jgi:mono/diheme cytochrome c family protein
LKKKLYNKNRFSIYEIVRKGTYSMPGAVPYVPDYPKEKLSDQQIEDLVNYILSEANNSLDYLSF